MFISLFINFKNQIMKKLIASLLAAVVVAVCFFSVKTYAFESFNVMMEQGDVKEAPGEKENCEEGGDKCTYTYDHRAYGIERSHNK